MRAEQPAAIAPSAVPEGWHPFQLRDKAAAADPEREAEIARRVDGRMLGVLAQG